jgi:hypothetical protein
VGFSGRFTLFRFVLGRADSLSRVPSTTLRIGVYLQTSPGDRAIRTRPWPLAAPLAWGSDRLILGEFLGVRWDSLGIARKPCSLRASGPSSRSALQFSSNSRHQPVRLMVVVVSGVRSKFSWHMPPRSPTDAQLDTHTCGEPTNLGSARSARVLRSSVGRGVPPRCTRSPSDPHTSLETPQRMGYLYGPGRASRQKPHPTCGNAPSPPRGRRNRPRYDAPGRCPYASLVCTSVSRSHPPDHPPSPRT